MHTKVYFVGLISLVLWVSCADNKHTKAEKQETTTEQVENEPTKEELEQKSKSLIQKLRSAESLGLQLNDGEPWVLEDSTYIKLMKIKQQIYIISGNMENYTIGSYNEMGNEFMEFVKTIPDAPQADVNTELQKVLSATRDEYLHLLGGDLQNAQIAVINMSVIYDEVPKYFVPAKK